MKCHICDLDSNFIDNYKLHIDYDKKFFNNLKIYNCSDCDFSFCYPMPSYDNLDFFYKQIYRSKSRPHQIFKHSIENVLYSDRNKNYIQYYVSFLIQVLRSSHFFKIILETTCHILFVLYSNVF